MKKVEFIPVSNIPLINYGDDIGEIITNRIDIKENDIVVICSTIVSKAEGRTKRLDDVKPSKKAIEISKKVGKPAEFVQVVLDESEEILIEYPFLLVKAKFGNICVNAGVDGSNIDAGWVILPPKDPEKSAERIRKRIESITGKRIGVIITDTNGRCFRKGVIGVSIGLSGVSAIRDWVGEKDLFGNTLEVTMECVADEISGMANLIMGEGDDGIPVVIVRGVGENILKEGSVKEIYRSDDEDIIRQIIKESGKNERSNSYRRK
jgi:coenzyme F420-0:L-glutamate ligase/coenzyme F420-1:gamma-L-glutamate ligase